MKYLNTVIIGTGSVIPSVVIENSIFEAQDFYGTDCVKLQDSGDVITKKFQDITGIEERCYATPDLNTSDLAAEAARQAIENAGIDPETLDQIILAHNFGNVAKGTNQTDILPGLAARVKHALRIKNPDCVAYDILFGCPGWIQGVIQADTYIKAGAAKRILVIGAEMLSRVVDTFDRDSMIFADGAGAAVIEAQESDEKRGIISYSVRTDTHDEAFYLYFGESNNPNISDGIRYIKMDGRKIYEYALSNVPAAMKVALDKSGVPIEDVKKIFIHQANEKMDDAILKRFYRLYKLPVPENIMPMSIHKLGNSSVATVPTLFDRVRRGIFHEEHTIAEHDTLLFASVGAGMHINAFVYKN